jgi:hypothetical protein
MHMSPHSKIIPLQKHNSNVFVPNNSYKTITGDRLIKKPQ